MNGAIDATHDPALTSWVDSANGHSDFPIQNLPLGVFSPPGEGPRIGVAIGDEILDAQGAAAAGLIDGPGLDSAMLNALLAQGAGPRAALRAQVSALLANGAPGRATAEPLLHDAASCTLHLPAAIGDYTDFYVGIHHAINIGKLFRPDAPLLANYKHVPIGYHGRASSVRPSGIPVTRPNGQRKRREEPAPSFGPCRTLDYELEIGIWIGGGNAPGSAIPIAEAARHIAGYCLLNDWSARDIQAWEYQPLGPFLAKSFATTISPWIVTAEALAPHRAAQLARAQEDPAPLEYLWDAEDQAQGALAVELEVLLLTAAMRQRNEPPLRVALSHARHLYWTPAQLVAHHSSNGCDLRPGDLFGSGTISAPTADGHGSMMELTRNGAAPITLPDGEQRDFLRDGDEVLLRGRAAAPGAVPIGFGECRAVVVDRPQDHLASGATPR